MCSRNQHNIVKQLDSNKKFLKQQIPKINLKYYKSIFNMF